MKGIFIIIFDKKTGKILAEKEISAKGGKYKLIGGRVDDTDPNKESALKREITEEIGIEVLDFTEFFDTKIDGHEFYFYYKIYSNFENTDEYKQILKHKNLDQAVDYYEMISINNFLENTKYESYRVAILEFIKLKTI